MTETKTYDPQDVRQGRIVLRHRWSHTGFIAGLACAVLLAVIGALAVFA